MLRRSGQLTNISLSSQKYFKGRRLVCNTIIQEYARKSRKENIITLMTKEGSKQKSCQLNNFAHHKLTVINSLNLSNICKGFI